MAKTFKEFYEGSVNSDLKKALNSLKESDDKYLEKRSAKYFFDNVDDDVRDIPLDEETLKKYLTHD